MKIVTTESFIKKAKLKHGDLFDYSLVDYKKAKIKVKIICSKHGVFEQQSNNHLVNKGCPVCANNTLVTKEQFIQKAILKHGNRYDYSLVGYEGSHTKIKIICQKHGIFEQQPTSHLMGSDCPKCMNNVLSTLEEFLKKIKQIHKDRYDYSLVRYETSKDKIKIICKQHGEFEQKASNHLRGDNCPACTGNRRLTKETFTIRGKLKHGEKYDYSLVEYINNSTKVKIICPIHGEFSQKANNHINGNGCPKCKTSKGEKIIREYLEKNNFKYIPQYIFDNCKDINHLKFDFYIPELNICIEYNGRQHYVPVDFWGGAEGLKQTKKRDNIKINYCKQNNINLIIIKHSQNILSCLKKKLF